MTAQNYAKAFIGNKRFHVKGFPKKWVEDNSEDASLKLYEALGDLIYVDNITVHESKQSNSHFAILDVARALDMQRLLSSLDEKDRLYLSAENCYLTIRKFHEPRAKSARRLVYSRDELLQLQAKTDRPRIHASVYALIKRTKRSDDTIARK